MPQSKIKKIVTFAVLAAIILISNGCRGKSVPYSDAHTPIKVKAGTEFVISLDSNVTTGYSWRLEDMPSTCPVKMVSSHYEAPQNQLPGAGGKELWTFKAVNKGGAMINLHYERPWENSPPIESKTFTVMIS